MYSIEWLTLDYLLNISNDLNSRAHFCHTNLDNYNFKFIDMTFKFPKPPSLEELNKIKENKQGTHEKPNLFFIAEGKFGVGLE